MTLSNIVQRGWEAVGKGDFDTLITDYTDDMTFVMPGQEDILRGRRTFRKALNNLGGLLPPGFEITELRQTEGENEVVSIVEWKADKIESSQLSVLFRFEGDKIYEERWFVDTAQWKSLF
ncbi:nuclear transport factor 2 family protein [Moritella marina]|uniref:nuclear transport factor 2 family protein n=1 Tax=Moritella marina TaxID=90736 RepID=UPI003703E621